MAAAPPVAPQPAIDHTASIQELIAAIGAPEFTKQDLMVRAYQSPTIGNDAPRRDAVANFVFTSDCDALLATLGYTVVGNAVTANTG